MPGRVQCSSLGQPGKFSPWLSACALPYLAPDWSAPPRPPSPRCRNTVHMLAPGEGIYSTFMDGGYKLMWGTSMACPMVAGAAALLQAAALRWVGWGWGASM